MLAALHVVAIGLFLSFPFVLIAWIFFWPVRHTKTARDCSHQRSDSGGEIPIVPTVLDPFHVSPNSFDGERNNG